MNVKDKGCGVITTKEFDKDDYICEYAGDLITNKKARNKETEHEHGGAFMFYFEHKGRKLWYNYNDLYHCMTVPWFHAVFCFIVWMLPMNQGRVKIQNRLVD